MIFDLALVLALALALVLTYLSPGASPCLWVRAVPKLCTWSVKLDRFLPPNAYVVIVFGVPFSYLGEDMVGCWSGLRGCIDKVG